MTRVHYDRERWDYEAHFRDFPWNASWIERPRLLASAVALTLGSPDSVCDPACGDGSVLIQANLLRPIAKATFGDISKNTLKTILPKNLPFEDVTVFHQDAFVTLERLDQVDAIVLTEILEHIENPDDLLMLAHNKARWLVASSPIVREGVADHTMQHVWSFDMDGYREMLEGAGWKPKFWGTANCADHPYADGFQVWGAER
jgi:2-polyprenyl-3-methyl-5-hydroxy-6-metoxy-1,4-benzoquinol methylase